MAEPGADPAALKPMPEEESHEAPEGRSLVRALTNSLTGGGARRSSRKVAALKDSKMYHPRIRLDGGGVITAKVGISVSPLLNGGQHTISWSESIALPVAIDRKPATLLPDRAISTAIPRSSSIICAARASCRRGATLRPRARQGADPRRGRAEFDRLRTTPSVRRHCTGCWWRTRRPPSGSRWRCTRLVRRCSQYRAGRSSPARPPHSRSQHARGCAVRVRRDRGEQLDARAV